MCVCLLTSEFEFPHLYFSFLTHLYPLYLWTDDRLRFHTQRTGIKEEEKNEGERKNLYGHEVPNSHRFVIPKKLYERLRHDSEHKPAKQKNVRACDMTPCTTLPRDLPSCKYEELQIIKETGD